MSLEGNTYIIETESLPPAKFNAIVKRFPGNVWFSLCILPALFSIGLINSITELDLTDVDTDLYGRDSYDAYVDALTNLPSLPQLNLLRICGSLFLAHGRNMDLPVVKSSSLRAIDVYFEDHEDSDSSESSESFDSSEDPQSSDSEDFEGSEKSESFGNSDGLEFSYGFEDSENSIETASSESPEDDDIIPFLRLFRECPVTSLIIDHGNLRLEASSKNYISEVKELDIRKLIPQYFSVLEFTQKWSAFRLEEISLP